MVATALPGTSSCADAGAGTLPPLTGRTMTWQTVSGPCAPGPAGEAPGPPKGAAAALRRSAGCGRHPWRWRRRRRCGARQRQQRQSRKGAAVLSRCSRRQGRPERDRQRPSDGRSTLESEVERRSGAGISGQQCAPDLNDTSPHAQSAQPLLPAQHRRLPAPKSTSHSLQAHSKHIYRGVINSRDKGCREEATHRKRNGRGRQSLMLRTMKQRGQASVDSVLIVERPPGLQGSDAAQRDPAAQAKHE